MARKKKSIPITPGFNDPLMQVGPDGKDYDTGLTVSDLYGDDVNSYIESTAPKPSDRKKKVNGWTYKRKTKVSKKRMEVNHGKKKEINTYNSWIQ